MDWAVRTRKRSKVMGAVTSSSVCERSTLDWAVRHGIVDIVDLLLQLPGAEVDLDLLECALVLGNEAMVIRLKTELLTRPGKHSRSGGLLKDDVLDFDDEPVKKKGRFVDTVAHEDMDLHEEHGIPEHVSGMQDVGVESRVVVSQDLDECGESVD